MYMFKYMTSLLWVMMFFGIRHTYSRILFKSRLAVIVWYDNRCWSKLVLSTIYTTAYDLEVKVSDLAILC